MEANKIELGVVPEKANEKEYKIVTEAAVARKLLKDGFTVADIKPKRGRVKETIFVFKVEDGLMDKIAQYTKDREDQLSKEE